MSPLDILSAFLDPDYHSDYWSDDRVLAGGELVLMLGSEDWDRLPALAAAKPAPWKARLADILDEAPPDKAIPLLLRLLLVPDPAVLRAVSGSLQSFHRKGYPIPLTPPALARLESLASASALHVLALEALIRSGRSALHPPPA